MGIGVVAQCDAGEVLAIHEGFVFNPGETAPAGFHRNNVLAQFFALWPRIVEGIVGRESQLADG